MENPFNPFYWFKSFKARMDKFYKAKNTMTRIQRENPKPEYYSAGIDPFTDLVNTGHCFIHHKIVDGEPVAEYNGRKLDIPFPDLMKDMLKFYPTPIVKERTDEDIRTELKAIAMFKPEVFKEFLKNDYERIINKDYGK